MTYVAQLGTTNVGARQTSVHQENTIFTQEVYAAIAYFLSNFHQKFSTFIANININNINCYIKMNYNEIRDIPYLTSS